MQLLTAGEAGLEAASQRLLEPLVISAASIAAALTVLGGLLSKYMPAIRAPLDIALDVDNHFREFPRTSIPRARIFSRYAALLGHPQDEGYGRIVIVAHSQGTVISAELLRYLSSDGRRAPQDGARPRLGNGKALPAIRLLTLGCPLRQLYAARFPTLYRWVIERRGAVSGPLASDIGVECWANAYCSGDYVGRWLWSAVPDDGDPVGHPMLDGVDGQALGRIDAYAGFVPMPPAAHDLQGLRELEQCVGLGAHTHYFEPDQAKIAWLVDHLLQAGGGGPVEPAIDNDLDADVGRRGVAAPEDGAGRATEAGGRLVAWGMAAGVALCVWRLARAGRRNFGRNAPTK